MQTRCLVTLIWKSAWAPLHDQLSEFFHAHKLRPSKFATESWAVFETHLDAAEATKLIIDFFEWLQRVGWFTQSEPPPWSIVATSRRLVSDWDRSPNSLPEWILAEFFNTIFVEEQVFSELERGVPDIAGRFEFREQFMLHAWCVGREQRAEQLPPPGPTAEVVVQLREMRNDPEAPAQKAIVYAHSFREVMEAAPLAYRDVPSQSQRGLGGLNALVLLSAERNGIEKHMEPNGEFWFFNTTALGLQRSQRPDSISNLVEHGALQLLEVVAEPRKEDEDYVSR